LADLIAQHPEDILGEIVVRRFGHNLPYLFKVLAAAQPLSIQAHPNLAQAKRGFECEEKAGIPMDGPQRNYKDLNHKPECICALTHFWALNGFRRIKEILSNLRECCPRNLATELAEVERAADASGLKRFFKALMTLEAARKEQVIQEALQAAQKGSGDDPAYEWVLKLYQAYPDDIGVLAPLFLNLVCLEPGQAKFLPSGQLHSYLDGTGIELMANSDNVLRGGLTPKHVDVSELLIVLDFEERPLSILSPVKKDDYEVVYDSNADEFVLSVICPPAGSVYTSSANRSVETLLCTKGRATLTDAGSGDKIDIQGGVSVLVPAAVQQYRIEGWATVYKAAVPL
jgi:mannose-6-phosphate isomerase